jgi:hypothetical protein
MFNRSSIFEEEQSDSLLVNTGISTVVTAATADHIKQTQVVLPSNVLDAPTNITITPVQCPPETEGNVTFSKVVDFGPGGTQFKDAVTIKIPYTQSDLSAAGITDAGRLRVFYYNLKTLMWEKLTNSYVDTAQWNWFALPFGIFRRQVWRTGGACSG